MKTMIDGGSGATEHGRREVRDPEPDLDGLDQLLPLERVASRLAISSRSVWREVASGELRSPIHVRGRARWFASDIQDYFERRRQDRDKGAHQ